jgi:hypothetical protein
VRGVEGRGQLGGDVEDEALGAEAPAEQGVREELIQRAAFHILQHGVEGALHLVQAKDPGDAGVLEERGEVDLLRQAPAGLGVVHEAQRLDHHRCARAVLEARAGQQHPLTLGAHAQLLEELVGDAIGGEDDADRELL